MSEQAQGLRVGSEAELARAKVSGWQAGLSDLLAGRRFAIVLPLLGAVLLVLFGVLSTDQYWLREISLIAVTALVVSGVNLSFGYAGEVQFGQVFMFALGAYVTMALAIRGFNQIVPLLFIGGLAAALVGFFVALPAVRIGGWSLAMASFFLVLTIPDLITILTKYTGGANGLVGIPEPSLFGTTLGENGLYEVSVIAALVWFACYRNLVTSRYGVTFRILRESTVLTRSLGFSTVRLKIIAYALGAFPAGVAGCLFGYISLIIAPSNFGLTLAIGVVAASVLGGIESVYGAAVAAAILQLGPEASLSFADKAPIVYGAFLIVAAVAFRRGLGGFARTAALRLSRKLVGESNAARLVSTQGAPANEQVHTADASQETLPAQAHSVELGPFGGEKLSVSSVSKSFGGVHALRDVSLGAQPGQVTGLIGSNGSGKTTLLNIVCGYAPPDQGSVQFGESTLTGVASHRIAKQGVARTFQTPSIPRGVSVRDVVASGRFQLDRCGVLASILRLPRYWRARRADRRQALSLLSFVGLAHVADEEADSLSLGMRRLIEVTRALCSQPRLLLLDEPASGLSEEEVELLGRIVRAGARGGATVILIEHNFQFVTSVSDTIHVLHLGELVASDTATAIAENPRVIQSYLGEGAAAEIGVPGSAPAARREVGGEIALELENAVSGYGDLKVLRGLSLSVKRGGIELVLGRNGVGKTTMLSAIAGQLKLWEGGLRIEGEDIGSRPPYRRAAAGIALVQEGKRIFRNRTVMENVVLGTYALKLSRGDRRALCMSVLTQFPVLEERANELAGGLSGGQQQMLAIAQALASRPRVLLLDEPSAGLAPSIVTEVLERLRLLSEEGMTIVLVEQLADQALPIASHVTAIDGGQVTASGPPADFRDRRVLQEAYFGASAGDAKPGAREALSQAP